MGRISRLGSGLERAAWSSPGWLRGVWLRGFGWGVVGGLLWLRDARLVVEIYPGSPPPPPPPPPIGPHPGPLTSVPPDQLAPQHHRQPRHARRLHPAVLRLHPGLQPPASPGEVAQRLEGEGVGGVVRRCAGGLGGCVAVVWFGSGWCG